MVSQPTSAFPCTDNVLLHKFTNKVLVASEGCFYYKLCVPGPKLPCALGEKLCHAVGIEATLCRLQTPEVTNAVGE